MSKIKLTTFGERIKKLRDDNKLPQRKVAALLDIDSSLLAKYERNERQPSRETIIRIASVFNVDSTELIAEAFSDKLAYQLFENEVDSKILRVVESKVEYLKKQKDI